MFGGMLVTNGLIADTTREERRAMRRTPVVEVFERSRTAVVNIAATEEVAVRSRSPIDLFFDDFFDVMPRQPRTRTFQRGSVGSGFVIHPDGYIVTNAHVVGRATELKVTFDGGREYDAVIVASDPGRDLAILKIGTDAPLPTLDLGRSDDLMIGETVVAIGNPLGYEHTVTSGVVSALDREIAVSPEVAFSGLIQTDASINPGNSGGPLLNVLGELIGVNTAIRGDAQNIGFAIPVDQLRSVLPELLDIERRYGVVTGVVIDTFDAPRVLRVDEESPAAAAGLRAGDVLVSVEGSPIREGIDFSIAMINRRPAEVIAVRVLRGGTALDLTLTLGLRPQPDGNTLAKARLGVVVRPLPADAARQLNLRGTRGVYVHEVLPGGAGEEAGLARGDIILSLGRRHFQTIEEMGQVLDQFPAAGAVQIRILRIEQGRKVQRSGPISIR